MFQMTLLEPCSLSASSTASLLSPTLDSEGGAPGLPAAPDRSEPSGADELGGPPAPSPPAFVLLRSGDGLIGKLEWMSPRVRRDFGVLPPAVGELGKKRGSLDGLEGAGPSLAGIRGLPFAPGLSADPGAKSGRVFTRLA